ncbi:MAG: phosphate signaling complex protein PhoU [Planctomycetota bacterium]
MPITELMSKLRQELAALSEMVERNVDSAVMSLVERSEEMASEVISFDTQVDEMEIAVKRRGIEILQLAHPKTDEFRFVIAAIQIAGKLDVIDDLTVDVAETVQRLIQKRSIQTDLSNFAEMLEFTSMMVRDSVASLLDRNEELAFRVCAHDELVAEVYQSLEAQLLAIMEEDAKKAVRATLLLRCACDLERIADHASGIAEDVIYILEGKIVSHHIEEWRKRLAPELEKRRAGLERRKGKL